MLLILGKLWPYKILTDSFDSILKCLDVSNLFNNRISIYVFIKNSWFPLRYSIIDIVYLLTHDYWNFEQNSIKCITLYFFIR